MKIKKVVFPAVEKVEYQNHELDTEAKKPDDLYLKNEFSVVSAGTECALFRGTESWAKHPISPGYGAVGTAVSVGEGFADIKEGDMVFTYGNHGSYIKAKRMILKVPDGLDPKLAVIARMAQVSFTPLRTSDAILGDTVAVIGQGLVGNIAAQLFANSGCKVIGIDVMDSRLKLAKECGINYTINAMNENVIENVKEITGGKMCSTVVEASGIPDQSDVAADLAGKKGEVILVGTPRGAFKGDAVEFLRKIHLWENGCVTFKGAHEWKYPDKMSPTNDYKISIEKNIMDYFQLVKGGKLKIAPLISHVADPSDCEEIYEQLNKGNPDYSGVVFKW